MKNIKYHPYRQVWIKIESLLCALLTSTRILYWTFNSTNLIECINNAIDIVESGGQVDFVYRDFGKHLTVSAIGISSLSSHRLEYTLRSGIQKCLYTYSGVEFYG